MYPEFGQESTTPKQQQKYNQKEINQAMKIMQHMQAQKNNQESRVTRKEAAIEVLKRLKNIKILAIISGTMSLLAMFMSIVSPYISAALSIITLAAAAYYFRLTTEDEKKLKQKYLAPINTTPDLWEF